MNAFIAIDRKLSVPEVRDAILALTLPEGEITTIKLRVYGGIWEVVCDAGGECPAAFNDRHRETFWLWEGDCPEEATNAAAWLLKS
jgi:hypothetical protein